ncbi:DinB family protein [Xanthomarina sp. GH4-25]|uniref:DinB family protein n=1 Tax=Xanthomarina sp. GH4-25 TaxID=3349335 RepID=UPI000D680123|nr:hypothetical protein DI383_13520 [Flavobacteriaceae bacterium LYZ1037]
MNLILKANLLSLKKSEVLLASITDDILKNKTVSPYYSSIGSHLRHILDFYDCILTPKNQIIDLTIRTRDLEVENCCIKALNYFNEIIKKMESIDDADLDRIVFVSDDLGLGKTDINYTFSGLLSQANSHTIHHYAIINYILEGIGMRLEDDTFGYNPTTPKINTF